MKLSSLPTLNMLFTFFTSLCLLVSCRNPDNMNARNQAISQIRQAEKEFATMAAEKGVPAAFLAFASDSAVLSRNNQIVQGKTAIKSYFDAQTLQDVSLQWEPDFVDASYSGDMGYTYGKYIFSAKTNEGEPVDASGIFHTVWKKQSDGTWKFVWD